MTENLVPSEWAAARAEKWRSQLSGMEGMLTDVNALLLQELHLNRPYRIAEIGCGGGGTALEILRHAPAGSVVHGFDISATLIEAARNRALPNEPGIAFAVADMATATPPEEPYNRLVSRFGVMFFDHPQAAFSNLFHWLAPGGRFAFAVWGYLGNNPWMTSVRDVVAEVVEVPPQDPDGPGAFRYADPDRLQNLLASAGFTELAVRNCGLTLRIGGGLAAAEAANFALSSFSSFGELLAEAGPDALQNARKSLTKRFASHQYNEVVQLDASFHVVTGAGG